ncbi:MAG TPA: TonB-dependent receptor [Pedomonas sp.]|uniref:TonB-dependent receptor n=1 Tax=Pedomonas sp. TaxID=2976421 RepID=UPI002F40ECB0
MLYKNMVASAVAMTAVWMAGPALGQTADGAQETADSTTYLQDIVVTAQRREESLQKVPVAVTAVSNEMLTDLRVTGPQSLSGMAPSVLISSQGSQSNPTVSIRGIASGTSNNAVDPKVGMYVDGVYIGRTVGSLFDLAEIERVEILRGPQGTLFGRNATTGAISLVTAAPTGEQSVRGSVSYGNYDAKRLKVSANLPEMGRLAVRFSYLHDETEGDVKNLLAGKKLDVRLRDPQLGVLEYADTLGARNTDAVQVAARLDLDAVTIDYRFDYTDGRYTGRGMQGFGILPDASSALFAPIVNLQALFGGITNLSETRLSEIAAATSVEHVITQGHNLTLTHSNDDGVTLKSITGFRKMNQKPNIHDLAGSGGLKFTQGQLFALLTGNITGPGGVFDPANLPGENDSFFSLMTVRSTKQKQFSQEFQLQLDRDAFQLTAGAFYFYENAPARDLLGIFQPVANGVVLPNPFLDPMFGSGMTITRAKNESYAGYTQLTYHLTDQLDLAGGIRFTKDKRETRIDAISGGQGGELGIGTYEKSYSRWNYTGILTWRPTDDTTAYAKIATGYVAGGVLSGIPYDPETLTSYELGLKAQWLDNRVRTNVALFYNDYKDLQTQSFLNGRQQFNNAGEATIKGFEAELDAVPVRGLTISANLSYSKVDYGSYILNGVDVADIARVVYTPDWTGRIYAQYDAPEFSNGSNLFAHVEAKYMGDTALVAVPITDTTGAVSPLEQNSLIDSYWLVNGRIGLANITLGRGTAQLSLYGQNLFNERYVPFGASTMYLSGSYGFSRTYGVELSFDF